MTRRKLLAATIGLAIAPAAPSVLAESHRNPQEPRYASFVMTNVIRAGQQELARHDVVFHDGLIFDFDRARPSLLTIFDTKIGQVTLVDTVKQVKASISRENLLKISGRAQQMLIAESDAESFGIGAEIKNSDDSRLVSCQFGKTSYEISTSAVDDRLIAIAYEQFVDMASRLNLARRIGGPPFARIAMHQRIGIAGRVPTRTTHRHGDLMRTATHRLGQPDKQTQDEINAAIGAMSLAREIELVEFN